MALTFPRRRLSPAQRWLLWLNWLVYGKTTFKPIWRAHVVSHDLLGQAYHLYQSGFHIAAGMMCRAWLERTLKRLCLITPTWRECRGCNAADFIEFLKKHEVLDPATLKLAKDTYVATSRICHTGTTTKGRLKAIFNQTEGIRKRVEEATRELLGRAS